MQLTALILLYGLHAAFCEWIGLPTASNQEIRRRGRHKYVLFVFKPGRATSYPTPRRSSELPSYLPSHIKVLLEELQPTLTSSGHDRVFSVVPLSHAQLKLSQNIYHEVRRKEYMQLQDATLDKVTIRLVDENNQPLSVLPGQPTIVKTKFEKLKMDGFILRVSSEDCKATYPNNRNNNFRLQLQYPIHLNQVHHEVAVSSMQYPNEIDVFKSLNIDNFWLELPVGSSPNRLDCSGRSGSGNSPIRDVKKLLLYIEKWADEKLGLNSLIFTTTSTPESREAHAAAVGEADDETTADESNDDERYEGRHVYIEGVGPTTVRVSAMLAHVLGHDRPLSHADYDEFVVRNEAGKTAHYYGTGISYNRLRPHSLLLYSSLGRPIIIGSIRAKVLKLIPIDKVDHASAITYESRHMDYVDIPHDTISSMDFELRDTSGMPIEFTSDEAVHINLLIRKK